MRIDELLVKKFLASSIKEAQSLILAGQVEVTMPSPKKTGSSQKHSAGEARYNQALSAGQLKPGTKVSENSVIRVKPLPKFVSRGGEKLQGALDYWNIQVQNRVCLDVGVSTGGFTDCLLQNGARKVYAVDVGYGQVHPKIRGNERVYLYEKTHILRWQFPWGDSQELPPPEITAIDLSFISLRSVLGQICGGVDTNLEVLALVKPQFELEQKFVRKGIVRDEEARQRAIQCVVGIAKEIHLEVVGHFPCSLSGMKGNREEWLYLRKDGL